MDGHAVNVSAARQLGYQLDPDNLTESVVINGCEVFLFFDYVHCIKLMRNVFASQPFLLNHDNERISWEFLVKLNDIQLREGLKLGNKLSLRHIEFSNKKMKVNLATQIFSKSVADALATMRELHNPDFQNSEATEQFLRAFNDLFDIFNSRSTASWGFKSPLSASNWMVTVDFLDFCVEYLGKLTLSNGNKIVRSRKKAGLIGFLVSIKSLKRLVPHLLNRVSYFCTYRLCQDHLELLFNSIRR